jgi:mycothiol synthase
LRDTTLDKIALTFYDLLKPEHDYYKGWNMMHFAALQTDLSVHPPVLADAERVVALINAYDRIVLGKADQSLDELRGEWEMPTLNLEQDARIVEADGQVVGYAIVESEMRPGRPFLDVFVHPDFEGRGIGEALLAWGESRARQSFTKLPADARVDLQAAAVSTDSHYKPLLTSAGMQPIRHHWRMEIELTGQPSQPAWPSGITVRPANLEQDARAVMQVRRAAFKDHWGNVERPFEEHFAEWLHIWQHGGAFDPALWFLALDGATIAGISLCRPQRGDETDLGWVVTLGVMRPYRRQGLGMALLLHSFNAFYQRGKRRVGLGVDAASLTGATRLYQRAGMHIAEQIDIYEKELRPGRDLSTHNLTD